MKIHSLFLATIISLFSRCSIIQPSQISDYNKTHIIELASGYIISRAIFAAAKIKVADCLVEGPFNIIDLAKKTDTNQDALHRLLRLLASYAIFQEDQNNNFSLTSLAEQLISTNENSVWAWLTYHHEPNRWAAYGNIEYSIRTGNPSFNHLFGKGYFDFISESTLLSQQFDEGMKNISADENKLIVQSYDFSPYPTIVDIGGGTGGFITEVIACNPLMHAILFDLPHVQISAENYIQQVNKSNNIMFVAAHDFFNPIPARADLYVLKRILHDWNDQDCLTILKNCHNAMHNNARLLIIETVLSEENIRDFAKDIDLEMMLLFGGKERTKKEWSHLLDKADLELITIHTTPSMLSILEVQKRTSNE